MLQSATADFSSFFFEGPPTDGMFASLFSAMQLAAAGPARGACWRLFALLFAIDGADRYKTPFCAAKTEFERSSWRRKHGR